MSPSTPVMHSGKGVLCATAKSSTTWLGVVFEGLETKVNKRDVHVALHLQVFTCMPSIMHMLTSSGAGTTAGWEAGVERLRPAENLLGAATGRGSKPAAEGFGPTGDLEATAAYEMR